MTTPEAIFASVCVIMPFATLVALIYIFNR